MWNLEKWYRWTILQSRNRVTDVENKLMVTKGAGGWDKWGNWDWHIYTTMYKITDENLGFPGGSEGKESAYKRPGFNPWVGKIPWRRAWHPTPVFLPGESPRTEEPCGLQSTGSQRVRHEWTAKRSTMRTYRSAQRTLLRVALRDPKRKEI